MSDISTLDEIEQNLNEYLNMEDNVKEEGPASPKINKSVTCPLMACNSFKYSFNCIYFRFY